MSAPSPESQYIATEKGIFTAAGHWYRTTEPLLTRYAAPVLERVPLARLLAAADRLLDAPRTLALWTLLTALAVSTAPAAAGAALLVFAAAFVLGPALASLSAAAVLKVLGNPIAQALAFIVVLTWLSDESTATVVTGLAGFVLLRWGIVERVLRPVLGPLRGRMYPIPVPDQTLRALIVRTALRHRLPLDELDAMEARVQEAVRRQR